jgi:nucleotide-binding universal stress UspA family protein
MTTVLAAIDDSAAAPTVLEAARVVAQLLDAHVRAIHVTENAKTTATAVAARAGVALRKVAGDPVEGIVGAAAEDDVALVVVGARDQPAGRRPVGHVALSVVEQVHKPTLVVPPDARLPAPGEACRRALVPLNGRRDSADAVAAMLRQLAGAGVELVALHVFVPETVPRFWDQAGHAEETWAAEFAATWCAVPGVDVRLRAGAPPSTVVEVATEEQADLIALAWSQELVPGRAEVVREVLAHAAIPVLLVPVSTTPAHSPP